MHRTGYFILLLLTAMAAAAWRTPEEIREEVRRVAELADAGDPEARYQLATILEQGFDTIPRDSIRAIELYRLAAADGWLPAQNYLGYYLVNHGDKSEGLTWLEKAAMAGDPKAQSNLGFLLLEQPSVHSATSLNEDIVADDAKAAFWLNRAAEAGVPTAASMLGDLYLSGRGVPQDSLTASSHYYAAIDAGLTDAAYKLEAMMHDRWLELAPEDQLRTALYLYTHRVPELAIPILTRLTQSDDPDLPDSVRGSAFALLGDAYTRAQGVGYSHELSLENYFKAANLGNAPAQFVIAELLEILPDSLDDLTDNPPSAEELRQMAASAGITSAEEATRRLLSF